MNLPSLLLLAAFHLTAGSTHGRSYYYTDGWLNFHADVNQNFYAHGKQGYSADGKQNFNANRKQNYDVLERLLGLHDLNHRIYQAFIKKIGRQKLFSSEKSRTKEDETYDFIVVGSGSAGSVVASRLSEIPQWKVLLLEVGRVESALTAIPVIAPLFQFTEYDWQYLMEYQEGFAMGMIDRRLAWPRGRALGGSSVINYMIYTRGNPLDFERWAAAGNPGWSYRDVLPYYLKSENSSLRNANPNYHSSSGEWSVEDSYQSKLVKTFIEGGGQLGFDYVDYATPRQIGFSTVQANLIGGRRHTTSEAFLRPVIHRRNLHVRTSAYVTKVLINPRTRRAYGVEFTRNGRNMRAYASKEVILSAGTFNSAQLLMLSGVGPRNHLDEMGIPVIEDLPVGQFLHDHITYVGLTFRINESISLDVQRGLRSKSIRDWLEQGTGPITSLGGVEGLAYIQALDERVPNFPDMELIFVGGALNSDYGLVARRSMRIRDDVYYPVWEPLHDVPTWTIFPMLLHPKSVGHLKLRSKNPFDYPLFYGNYFSDAENVDLRTMIASIRFIIELSKTPAFQRYDSRLHDIPIPGCEAHAFNSDPYWECALRSLSITLHHQVGTCKMGPNDDPSSVVNHELKVYGVAGLRVADCSIIPFAITAHTSAPAVMVGEKAADLIKRSWGVIRD